MRNFRAKTLSTFIRRKVLVATVEHSISTFDKIMVDKIIVDTIGHHLTTTIGK